MRVRSHELFKAIVGASGMSYRELAAEAGCKKTMIYNLANGVKDGCTLKLAKKLAAALKVDPELLFVRNASNSNSGHTQRGALVP
jgi:DNA-binding XRE family transcriptional regulator